MKSTGTGPGARRSPSRRDLAGVACHPGIFLASSGSLRLTACLALGLTLLAGSVAPAQEPAVTSRDTLRVGEIRLDLDPIFTPSEVADAGGLNRTLRRTMNALHADTRPWVVRQELLFREGDPFDPALLAESARNLRRLGILNQVSVTPVDTTADGRVHVRVHTRETWTLALGVNFSLASSGAVRWNLSLTEENFLGTALLVRTGLGDDLDARYGRIYLRQHRVLRSPLTVELNVDERTDGYDRWGALSVPFRSDDQAWQVKTRAWERRHDTRWYLSNGGPAGADPQRAGRLYALLPRRSEGFRVEAARRLSPTGRGRIWRLGAAWHVTRLDWDLGAGHAVLSDGRVADLGFLAAPGSPLDRERGTRSWPHLVVYSHGRHWTTTRFLRRYGNQEDVPLDPTLELRAGPAGAAVGSSAGSGDPWSLQAVIGNWDRVGRAFAVQQVIALADVGGAADDRNHYLGALAGWYQRLGLPERPYTWKAFVEAVHTERLTGDRLPALGLDRGLRTLDVDGMAGEELLRWNTELGRVLPWEPLGLARVGWGAFYAGGLARFRDEDRTLADARHEVGLGLRFGGVRSGNSELARLDLTYDLTGEDGLVITTATRGTF